MSILELMLYAFIEHFIVHFKSNTPPPILLLQIIGKLHINFSGKMLNNLHKFQSLILDGDQLRYLPSPRNLEPGGNDCADLTLTPYKV